MGDQQQRSYVVKASSKGDDDWAPLYMTVGNSKDGRPYINIELSVIDMGRLKIFTRPWDKEHEGTETDYLHIEFDKDQVDLKMLSDMLSTIATKLRMLT